MKPILFNTGMVRAILEDRKTVTRRVVKQSVIDKFVLSQDGKVLGSFNVDHPQWGVYPTVDDAHYQPGDILYVRETWAKDPFGDGYIFPTEIGGAGQKWHPSIHMPREAARIFLRVTDVRVERLRDITEEQARAEGVEPLMMTADVDKPDGKKRWQEVLPALPRFPEVWNITIKPADRALYGWEANPWVFVTEFERISKEEAMK